MPQCRMLKEIAWIPDVVVVSPMLVFIHIPFQLPCMIPLPRCPSANDNNATRYNKVDKLSVSQVSKHSLVQSVSSTTHVQLESLFSSRSVEPTPS
jgi:hypothetical protein